MTGANFAVASTGEIVVCTNEGNADMGTSFPKVHIATFGMEKIVPNQEALGVFTRLLARSGTGQPITSYTSHYRKPQDGGEFHLIIVDNGRSDILAKPPLTMLLGAVDAVTGGFRREDMFRYLKTGMAGITAEECDLLENYVILWSIRGNMWLRDTEWTANPDGYGQEMTPERQQRLAEENLPITLSISLHAPTDEARRRIMPVANKFGISRLMESCRNYVNHTGRRIVFEYALIEGVNTALEDADQLAALTRGLLCHVNLIPLNDVPERSLRAPGRKGIDAFQHRLEELGVSVTRRREMGADIEGACGQLRRKHLSTEGS